mgnify:CR=1 FL=1
MPNRRASSAPDLEANVAEAYERCHPGDTFRDLNIPARFSKEDRGLLTDWMAAFANRQGGDRHQLEAGHTRMKEK